ncbi:MAG: tetratricopeptide repeat protein [Gemmatimonadota bacterium]
MTDHIHALTAELAANSESLVFLRLGEALRRRRQLDAALTVATGGVQRHPHLADSHDLLARVRSDRGEGDAAFDAWTQVLRLVPGHLGALRGLAFLAFRAGDMDRAERHLEAAVGLSPTDPALRAALQRVRDGQRQSATTSEALTTVDVAGTLLLDEKGRRLAGLMLDVTGSDVSDPVAAELAGVRREAERTARLVGLGEWQRLVAESPDGYWHLAPPTDDTLLLVTADPGTPPGRVAIQADRAFASARRWRERMR